MSNSKLVTIISALAAALAFLAGYHWTGTDAGTIGTVIGIVSVIIAGVNQELHATGSTGVTWFGVISLVVSAVTKFETSLPPWVPLVLGVLGAVLAAAGAPIANVPAVSASEVPH